MPTGLLVPGASAPAAAVADAATPPLARGMKAGPWTELQIAAPSDTADRTRFEHWRDDSWFVSLEAMTQMHEAFARALPGFDLFLPRLFPPDALVRLDAELTAYANGTSGDVASAAREVARVAASTAAKKQSLWVLGP
jgi:hypothetical protein